MSDTRTWVAGIAIGTLFGAGAVWWWSGSTPDAPVAQASNSESPAPTVTITAPAPTPDEPSGEATPGTFVIPAALQGTWCTRSGNDPMGGASEPCFSFADLLAKYPGMTLDEYEASDSDTPSGALTYAACLELDMLPVGCSVAASMLFEFYPVGVAWDCQAAAATFSLPSCDPDFTASHDLTQPRLTIRPNHQQGDLYYDTEPMYQQP